MTITFRPGLLPPQPGRRRLRLADYLTVPAAPALPGELPSIPTSADYIGEVSDWPMYGNDTVGDCGPAGLGHLVETYTRYAGGTTVEVSESGVLDFYSKVSGYRPGHPSTDVGVVLQDMLDYARQHSFCGHEILAFAEVDMSNVAEIRAAIDLFGGIITGINLPQSAEDQFNAGQRPWTVVNGSKILGGHAVPWMRYGADGSWGGVTWAAVQPITDPFRKKYVAEGWVLFPKDWANAEGITPTGLDLHTLGTDFAALTGEANPYPDAPPVVPPPAADGPSGVQVGTAVRSLLDQLQV